MLLERWFGISSPLNKLSSLIFLLRFIVLFCSYKKTILKLIKQDLFRNFVSSYRREFELTRRFRIFFHEIFVLRECVPLSVQELCSYLKTK